MSVASSPTASGGRSCGTVASVVTTCANEEVSVQLYERALNCPHLGNRGSQYLLGQCCLGAVLIYICLYLAFVGYALPCLQINSISTTADPPTKRFVTSLPGKPEPFVEAFAGASPTSLGFDNTCTFSATAARSIYKPNAIRQATQLPLDTSPTSLIWVCSVSLSGGCKVFISIRKSVGSDTSSRRTE